MFIHKKLCFNFSAYSYNYQPTIILGTARGTTSNRPGVNQLQRYTYEVDGGAGAGTQAIIFNNINSLPILADSDRGII